MGPLISKAPKRTKFRKFLDLENFSLDFAFDIRGQIENTPYSSSEPNCDDVGDFGSIIKQQKINQMTANSLYKYINNI